MRFWVGFTFVLVGASCATSPALEPHEGVSRRWGQFLSMPHQRAFALAGDPDGRWVGATVGGYRTPIDAEHAALDECEKRRSAHRVESPCRLYAVGHRIVWSEEAEN